MGSATGLTSVLGLWITAITAAVNSSTPFYSNNGIISLFITALAGSLAFFGLRLPSVQGLVKKGTDAHDTVAAYAAQAEVRYQELLAQYTAQRKEFDEIIKGVSDAQDGLPDDIKDEVVTTPSPAPTDNDDTQAPPA
jgi:hypothetical protein